MRMLQSEAALPVPLAVRGLGVIQAATPKGSRERYRGQRLNRIRPKKATASQSGWIEVLMEVIRAGQVLIGPAEVVQRLHGRGIQVSVGEAEQVFACYGLNALKKTPR